MLQNLLMSFGTIALIYAFYKWVISNNNFFKDRGVTYLEPYFLFGNSAAFWFKRYTPVEYIESLYNSFPTEKITGFFDFRNPVLLLRDPETIKQLAVKDFDYFEDHNPFLDDKVDDILGNSLFLLRGQKWRQMRATLSPAFTGSKMRQMFELVTETAEEMAKHFRKRLDAEKSVDCEMKDLFSKYTNDVIASTAFGIKVNSFENAKNDFYVAGQKFLNLGSFKGVMKIIFIRLLPRLASKLNVQFIEFGITNFFKSMILGNIETREKEKIFRPDMINILMQVRKGNVSEEVESIKSRDSDGFATVEESNIGKTMVNRKWTDNEIVAQCFLFFAAGFDTSSTLLSFVMYELTINADIEQKLYEEVLETSSKLMGKRISYDVLQQMTYLDMVISETLRRWPPVPFLDRICVKDYDYNDDKLKFKINKDVPIWIPVYPLHHDPKYFPNPSKFDPERFSDENKGSIVPGTYLPFGVGPRNCIGSRFALMEVKAIIYYLVLNLKFEPNAKSQIPVQMKRTPIGLQTERGIHFTMKAR